MVESIVADTCVWSDYFMGEPVISKKLETVIKRETVYFCGIILLVSEL